MMNALSPRLLLLCAAAASLVGCSSYGPGSLKPGATVAETTASMGPPTARYAAPGGTERLEYQRGPAGLHTYMLDFDGGGRLTQSNQVLTEAQFNAVPWGISREQVLETLGHPGNVIFIGWQKRKLWSYSYDNPLCQWFQVSLDTQDKVVETGYGSDPRCQFNNPNDK